MYTVCKGALAHVGVRAHGSPLCSLQRLLQRLLQRPLQRPRLTLRERAIQRQRSRLTQCPPYLPCRSRTFASDCIWIAPGLDGSGIEQACHE